MKALSAVVLILAGPLSACPTAADLDRGIVITDQDDIKTLFQRVDGRIQRTEFFDTDEVYRSDLVHGTFWTNEETVIDGVRQPLDSLVVTLRTPEETFARPRAGLRQSIKTDVTYTGEAPFAETITQAWDDIGLIKIGDCTYKALSGTIDYDAFGESSTDIVRFLPALGLTLIIGDDFPEEEPYLYPPQSIEVLEN